MQRDAVFILRWMKAMCVKNDGGSYFRLMEILVYDGWRLCGLRSIEVLWGKMDGGYVV